MTTRRPTRARPEFFAALDRLVREPSGPAPADPGAGAPAAPIKATDDGGPPEAEERALLETAQRLAALYRPLRRAPPSFQDALERRLLAQLAQPSQREQDPAGSWWQRLSNVRAAARPAACWPPLPSTPGHTLGHLAPLALAAVVVLALASGVWWATRPSAVSAETVLAKADAAARAAGTSGVRSFVFSRTTLAVRPGLPEEGIRSPYRRGEQYRTASTRWFEAPDRVRDELEEAVLAPDGSIERRSQSVTVRDGTDEWLYRPQDNHVVVNRQQPGYKAQDGQSPYLPTVGDVGDLLQRSRTCATATLRGGATIAGRAAYVIELGPADLARCPPVDPARRLIGRQVLWFDQATFFLLKEERYDRADGGLRSTGEVTRVEYNVPIDPERFTFTPPIGATVRDLRPPPLPSPAGGDGTDGRDGRMGRADGAD